MTGKIVTLCAKNKEKCSGKLELYFFVSLPCHAYNLLVLSINGYIPINEWHKLKFNNEQCMGLLCSAFKIRIPFSVE